MARPNHVVTAVHARYCARRKPPAQRCHTDMQYLPLFLLFMAVLIAAYFYLENAKKRESRKSASTKADAPAAAPSVSDTVE